MKRVSGLWKDYSQYEKDDVVSMFLNSMAAAYDPHSSYLGAQHLNVQQRRQEQLHIVDDFQYSQNRFLGFLVTF